MGWIEDKEKLEADRRDAHRRYMRVVADLKDSEEEFEELILRIPALKEQAHKLRCKRDRLDNEWEAQYKDDSTNEKKAKLEKLKAQIKKLEGETAYSEGND